MFYRVFSILLLISCFWGMTSCSPFLSNRPSFLLIVIESFSEKDFLCADTRLTDGLDSLNEECENFIRFTHAFAPSSMSQVSLATLLTGKTWQEHKVIHNGSLPIPASYQTLAELAISQGMKTAFFSGGVPLMPKFGVRQGYEFFNDSFSQVKPTLFRPFFKTLERSLQWLDLEVKNRPFFMTYYIPDLVHKDFVTKDSSGEERPLSRNSSLIELYESLDKMISLLKKRKKWQNTHVVVVGLNGESLSFFPSNPLNSQRHHVPLQIKWANKTLTNLESLKSEIISFDRLGKWMRRLIQYKPSQEMLHFESLSSDYFISQASHWKQWLGLSNWADIGLRKKRYLFSLIPNLKIFDSFEDKNENQPLSEEEAFNVFSRYGVEKKIRTYFVTSCYDASFFSQGWKPSFGLCPKPELKESMVRDVSLIANWSDLISDFGSSSDQINQLVNRAKKQRSPTILGWLAYYCLYQKKWASLFELGKYANKQAWILVAQLNLHETPDFELNKCLKFFGQERLQLQNFYQICQDSGLRKVVEGIHQLKNKKKPSHSFWDQVSNIKRFRQAKNINLRTQFLNHVTDPFSFEPSLSELYFFLPENSDFQKLIKVDKS